MLGKYHADGNTNDPIVQFEYAEIKETIRLEFLAKKTSSYLDFFKTKGNRYRLFLIISAGLFSQWSGNALFSYVLLSFVLTFTVLTFLTQLLR